MQRAVNIATAAIILWLLFCIAYNAAFVWLYPMHDEASVLHYLAWMIDTQHTVPYRDLFETAFPGSLLFHLGIGRLLGYDDNAFRIADYLWLTTLLLVTWAILRRIDRRVALIIPFVFAGYYFKAGAGITLQRDSALILPIAGALLVVLQTHWQRHYAALLCGLLFGLAASSKPHSLIGLPPLLWLLLWPAGHTKPTRRMIVHSCMWGAAGLLTGFGLPLLWLWQRGGLGAFVDMVQHYMPLYADMGGFINTSQPPLPLLASYFGILLYFGGITWLILLPIALWNHIKHPATAEHHQMASVLLQLACLYLVYVYVAGKFYNYHWMPFRYFALLASSTLLLPPQTLTTTGQAICYAGRALLFTVLAVDFACPSPASMRANMLAVYSHGYHKQDSSGDVMAALIRQYALPGDRVQPLDTGGSAMRGLLLSQTVLATPISSYGDLFHHTDQPAIQRMRQHFLQTLQKNPPVLIVDKFNSVPANCETLPHCRFDAFDQWLSAHYRVLTETCHEGHCILRLYGRNPP